MPPTDTDDETAQRAQPRSRGRIGLIVLFALLVFFLLIAFLPPLVNVSRFQQRIATNIGNALGRPVHFDKVSLTLLPQPGFTLTTFVIDEDPAFGYEPILRADQVQVTLRISSLWRSHVEFSKIAFTEPSVNLVHAANGKWNIESLLLQASHIQAAPTGQRFAGPARRFPYIEATGARINLKFDQEKMPVAFTDTDFALWLPEPQRWHLRLAAHPVRTDTSPGDTGTIRVDGTLGGTDLNAASLAQIAIDLHGDWQDAQLGGLSRLFLGHDSGVRGDFSLSFGLLGTVGANTITADIKLAKARRADFVPAHMLSLEAACKAVAGDTFHSFTAIECNAPPANSSDPSLLIVTGNLPDVHNLATASAHVTIPALPADTLFDWLSVATPHPPAVLEGAGTLAATLAWNQPDDGDSAPVSRSRPQAAAQAALTGEIEFSGGSIDTDPASNRSVPLGDVLLHSTGAPAAVAPRSHLSRRALAALQDSVANSSFDLEPVSLALGGKQPAIFDGHFDANGYTLHLAGTVVCANLLELGNAIPQVGDGLEPLIDEIAAANPDPDARLASKDTPAGAGSTTRAPLPTEVVHVDLTATRTWGGPQVWRQAAPATPSRPKRR
jgi:AsmA family